MTLETPTNLGQLRSALVERCQLDTNDPRASAATLDMLINMALRCFQVANPLGWAWDFTETACATIAGDERLPLAFEEWSKIRYVVLRETISGVKYPLERLTRAEQLERYPNDSEQRTPVTFSILGSWEPLQYIVRFRPVPDAVYALTIGGRRGSAGFIAITDPLDTDDDYMLEHWSDVVLEYAAYLCYRSRGDLAEAVAAKAAYDAEVMRLRRAGRRTVGAGVGQRPVNDELRASP